MSESAQQRIIGGNAQRLEAREKVTGEIRYVEDMSIPGLLHAAVLRSPHPHARLLGLDAEAARQLPGIEKIITAKDIPGENGCPAYSRDEPLLTPIGDTTKTIGAPMALVIAATPQAALAGAAAIQAQYDLLPHAFSLSNSPRPDGQIYPNGDMLNQHRSAQGDIEAAFTGADIIVTSEYSTSYQEHCALECESVLGYFDGMGRLTVVGGTHEPHWQQQWIANTCGLDIDEVRFIMPPTGGSFGGKQDPWPLLAVGLAVALIRKPVRLVYSRGESFTASPKRHPYHMQYKIGATQQGQLTGIQVSINANTGGYDASGYYIPEYAVMASGGAYNWQAADIQAQVSYSNGPKCGQFRGFGTPQPTFALECALDELIEKLGADPIEFRQNNRIEQSTITYLGYPVAERLGYAEVLNALKPRFDVFQNDALEFNAAAQAEPGNPYRKGIGVAGMWYRFGKAGSLHVEAYAELSQDGGFLFYCSAPDYGQGIETVMLQLGAETLGVPREQISLVNADTAQTPDSGIQGASRATYWVGNAICQAAMNLKNEVLGIAAELLDCAPDELVLETRRVRCLHDDEKSISLQDLAGEFKHMNKPLKVRGVFDLSPLFPDETRPNYTPHFVTGAHLAEVIVDTQTGITRVTRFVAAHDIGRAINHQGAEGQIEGAILMGLGSALFEEYIPGQTSGLTDYVLPMVGEMPQIETILVEVPSYQGPLGAKGVGETAMLPSTPAIINAVSRAISTRIRHIPATPERIFAAINLDSRHCGHL